MTSIEIRGSLVDFYTRGEYLDEDRNAISVVGARKASKRGIELSYRFSYELAKAGFTIVSGLALGIDTWAHKGALDAGGRTIAVLAHGLDTIYPKQNADLASRICKRGCLITKFKEGTPPLAKNFLARNQVIAGLSRAVLVVEGEIRSGSVSTANHAANLGIEVFAIPGSAAADWLIENGATAVSSYIDVLKSLDPL